MSHIISSHALVFFFTSLVSVYSSSSSSYLSLLSFYLLIDLLNVLFFSYRLIYKCISSRGIAIFSCLFDRLPDSSKNPVQCLIFYLIVSQPNRHVLSSWPIACVAIMFQLFSEVTQWSCEDGLTTSYSIQVADTKEVPCWLAFQWINIGSFRA